MDSFLLLRRLVAAIVFKGQTVSDYWWSRRTIFLTILWRSKSNFLRKKRNNNQYADIWITTTNIVSSNLSPD